MVKKINLFSISPEFEKRLGEYLLKHSIGFVARKSELYDSYSLSHNLIRDMHNQNQFHMISNLYVDCLGIGSFGKIRRIIGVINIDPTTEVATFQPIRGKVVKILNPKSVQKKRDADKESYRHSTSIKFFENSKSFPHIGMQKPIKREAYLGRSQFEFKEKSYSVMSEFPGKDLDKAIDSFLLQRPSILNMLTTVFLPLLKAYQVQIQDVGFAHRDIKPANIRANLNGSSTVINFLDVDFSRRLGAEVTPSGTIGFMAPELWSARNTVAVKSSQDVFALGIVLICCLNPSLHPHKYILTVVNSPTGIEKLSTMIEAEGFYHFSSLDWGDMPTPGLFDRVDSSALPENLRLSVENQIIQLLQIMTSYNPDHRPDIGLIIARVMGIQREIEDGLAPKRRMGCC